MKECTHVQYNVQSTESQFDGIRNRQQIAK